MSSKEIVERMDASSVKNNRLLIVFYVFGLYVLISTLSTTDLMLLLPIQTFEMPLLSFNLDLIYFYVLAPLLLLILHFNLLLNYMVHLVKLKAYKDDLEKSRLISDDQDLERSAPFHVIDLETIGPSLYGYAFVMSSRGLEGMLVNLFLWLLIYFLPMFVLVIIYQKFAAYHHFWITTLHLSIIFVDALLVFYSIRYNRYFLKHSARSIKFFSRLFIALILFVTVAETTYFALFFYPMVKKDYDTESIRQYEKKMEQVGFFRKSVCRVRDPLILFQDTHERYIDCFPRLVVKEEEMAKISADTLYIPRQLAIKKSDNEQDDEKQLILQYGARIDLKRRNLRYADLKACILTRADMEACDLKGADLSQSHLQATILSGAQLQGANMQESQLQEAFLDDANLSGAMLSRANLENAIMSKTDLSYANLQSTRFDSNWFVSSSGEGSVLKDADMNKASLQDVSFANSDLTGTSFCKATLINTDFFNTSLIGADLSEAKVDPNSSFIEARTQSMNIYNTHLLEHGLDEHQMQLIVNIDDSSSKYLTFHGRRVKYLDPYGSKEKFEKKTASLLRRMQKRSCQRLVMEAASYQGNKETYDAFKALKRKCASII